MSRCPDDGTCHHECARRCFRVLSCAPLSDFGVKWWPEHRSMVPTPLPGDAFRFAGLDGRGDDESEIRLLTIISISVAGSVCFRIDMAEMEPGLHSAPLADVLLLIDRGIWTR